jgi:uncharacterized protein YjbJ (UPF0337 family)
MNKDRVEGKVKDVTGRVERQAGEWLGDTEKQAHGAVKQAEGKVQNTWGKVKDAAKNSEDKTRENDKRADETVETEADVRLRRKAG